MDYLMLSGMQFYAYHGVNAQENKVGNTFFIDLKIGGDFSKACLSDNVADALNYASIYETVKHMMDIPCHLLEHLAETICQELKKKFPQIESIEIKLSKTNPPLFGQLDSASVILFR
jgi:dihydroneopterin aldolase